MLRGKAVRVRAQSIYDKAGNKAATVDEQIENVHAEHDQALADHTATLTARFDALEEALFPSEKITVTAEEQAQQKVQPPRAHGSGRGGRDDCRCVREESGRKSDGERVTVRERDNKRERERERERRERERERECICPIKGRDC